MNDLVYVMYNLKLKNRQIRKIVDLPFDDIQSHDEWITEEGDNVDVEQTQVKGDGENDDLAGTSMNDPTTLDGHAPDGHAPDGHALDRHAPDGHAPNLDNIVFHDNDNESSGEELDGDEDDDEEDGGDDFIRRLDY